MIDDKGVCVGVIDMLDIVSHAIAVAPDPKYSGSSIWSPATNAKLALESAGRCLSLQTAASVMSALFLERPNRLIAHQSLL